MHDGLPAMLHCGNSCCPCSICACGRLMHQDAWLGCNSSAPLACMHACSSVAPDARIRPRVLGGVSQACAHAALGGAAGAAHLPFGRQLLHRACCSYRCKRMISVRSVRSDEPCNLAGHEVEVEVHWPPKQPVLPLTTCRCGAPSAVAMLSIHAHSQFAGWYDMPQAGRSDPKGPLGWFTGACAACTCTHLAYTRCMLGQARALTEGGGDVTPGHRPFYA